jgi:hypothetical protein
MHNELYPLLNAYLDGELHGKRLREMQTHLETCEICRTELTELRRVSDILQSAPAPEFTPADRFASNLTLSLPRHPQRTRPQRLPSFGWWLVPAGLLGAWFFLQTVFTLTDIIHVVNYGGMLGQIIPWLNEGTSQTAWFAMASNLFGMQLNAGQQSTLSLLNKANIFGVDLIRGLLWQAGFILLCLGWIVSWMARGESAPIRIKNIQ